MEDSGHSTPDGPHERSNFRVCLNLRLPFFTLAVIVAIRVKKIETLSIVTLWLFNREVGIKQKDIPDRRLQVLKANKAGRRRCKYLSRFFQRH